MIEILQLKIENLQLRIALAHTNRALADANIEMLTPQLKALQLEMTVDKSHQGMASSIPLAEQNNA